MLNRFESQSSSTRSIGQPSPKESPIVIQRSITRALLPMRASQKSAKVADPRMDLPPHTIQRKQTHEKARFPCLTKPCPTPQEHNSGIERVNQSLLAVASPRIIP